MSSSSLCTEWDIPLKKEKRNKVSIGKKLPGRVIAILAATGYASVLAIGIAFIVLTSFFSHKNDLTNLATNRGEYAIHNFTSYPDQTFSTDFFLFTEKGILVVKSRSFLADEEIDTLRGICGELLENGSVYRVMRLYTGTSNERPHKTICIVAGEVVTAASGIRFNSFVVRDIEDIGTTIIVFAGIYTLLYAVALILLLIITKQHQNFVKLQRDLVSNVSHELKTPITSIKAMGELIYDGMYANEEECRRFSRTIINESDHLKELVGEILDLGRLQSNRVEFHKTTCFADGIFTPVIDNFMMMAGDLGVELDASGLDFGAIPPLYTDQIQIVKVWRIILENAVKFAGTGGKVLVQQQISSKRAVFSISDNGPGIKQEDIERIFERFYKADITHNSQGSGLGLSIAAEIIRGLDEKIWVESVEGKGSTFYFTVGYRPTVQERLLSRS